MDDERIKVTFGVIQSVIFWQDEPKLFMARALQYGYNYKVTQKEIEEVMKMDMQTIFTAIKSHPLKRAKKKSKKEKVKL